MFSYLSRDTKRTISKFERGRNIWFELPAARAEKEEAWCQSEMPPLCTQRDSEKELIQWQCVFEWAGVCWSFLGRVSIRMPLSYLALISSGCACAHIEAGRLQVPLYRSWRVWRPSLVLLVPVQALGGLEWSDSRFAAPR